VRTQRDPLTRVPLTIKTVRILESRVAARCKKCRRFARVIYMKRKQQPEVCAALAHSGKSHSHSSTISVSLRFLLIFILKSLSLLLSKLKWNPFLPCETTHLEFRIISLGVCDSRVASENEMNERRGNCGIAAWRREKILGDNEVKLVFIASPSYWRDWEIE
jgi:hypothetical protein